MAPRPHCAETNQGGKVKGEEEGGRGGGEQGEEGRKN